MHQASNLYLSPRVQNPVNNKPVKPLLAETSRIEVIRSFCRWTGVRGLQHILRVEHPVLRTIWAVFGVFMLFGNIGLITLLLTHYYRFNTIENIKIQRGIPVEFPHVTLCNVDPVNSDRVHCLKNADLPGCAHAKKYVYILEKYMTGNNYFEHFKNSSLWSKLEDPSMVAIFYQLIGMEAASHIGHQLDDFIIPNLCELTTREKGGILVKRKCKRAGLLALNFVTYKHFNCYTLAISDRDLSNRAIRLSVVLYLDEEEDLMCRPYCTHEFTEWAGAKVVVHPVNTFPDIEQMGMNLLPGASNQILIDEIRQFEKKDLSSDPCEKKQDKTLPLVYFNIKTQRFETREMAYTDTLCVQLRSQEATIKNCQCVDLLMRIPGSQLDKVDQLPFCGNLSRPDVDANLECNQHVRLNNSKLFRQLCPMPCVHMQYNYELTQLRWPQKPRILKYYKELKDRVYYKRKFKVYEEIEELALKNATLALEMLQKTDIFEKNMLQLDINRPNVDTLVKYTENEEYTLPTLMSQLGGINSIFLGFTCITILELIELGFRLTWVTWPSLNPIVGWMSRSNSTSGAAHNPSIVNQETSPELTAKYSRNLNIPFSDDMAPLTYPRKSNILDCKHPELRHLELRQSDLSKDDHEDPPVEITNEKCSPLKDDNKHMTENNVLFFNDIRESE
ncbi:uncharacterized protein DEA37_0013057 [Paragonimus westermani]|uniref:FMRFamide-activated amiloride-sensitive sodium channel n=1 Tax=Paragonimus westermani TaxID=34504 RepID=A0A5J4NUA5_9TREM|nr:uncharacterized protein DEA37_0013057 [Paragonimus westermani]